MVPRWAHWQGVWSILVLAERLLVAVHDLAHQDHVEKAVIALPCDEPATRWRGHGRATPLPQRIKHRAWPSNWHLMAARHPILHHIHRDKTLLVSKFDANAFDQFCKTPSQSDTTVLITSAHDQAKPLPIDLPAFHHCLISPKPPCSPSRPEGAPVPLVPRGLRMQKTHLEESGTMPLISVITPLEASYASGVPPRVAYSLSHFFSSDLQQHKDFRRSSIRGVSPSGTSDAVGIDRMLQGSIRMGGGLCSSVFQKSFAL